MPNSISYRIGRWIGRLPTWGKMSLVAFIILTFYRSCSIDSIQKTGKTSSKANDVASIAENAKKLCLDSIAEIKQQYADLTIKKQHWTAANTIRSCAERLESTELRSMVKDAEVASHLGEINNPLTSPRTRAKAMQELGKDYPEIGLKYAAQAEKLVAEADKKDLEIERKRKKSEGVRVGMSKEDVLASSWGKPKSINTTITANSEREQWVYGSGNYLYFVNGILVTIQN